MSTVMVLRHLGQSFKSMKAIKNHGNLFRFSAFNPAATTQSLMTKFQMSTTASSGQVNRSEEWRVIYRLPLIRLASAFNRVKIPYGFLNGITIPAAFALEQASQLPPTTSLLIGIVGITSWCTLAISSFFIQNLVGIIYINDNGDKLKLAYVDYWGKRHDVCIELDDLITEGETLKPSKFNFYQTLCLYSDSKAKYKLLPNYGSIEDLETFVAIFGE